MLTKAMVSLYATARTLVMVCKLTDDQAYDVMMHAHRFGTAVVGSYTKETAEVSPTQYTIELWSSLVTTSLCLLSLSVEGPLTIRFV